MKILIFGASGKVGRLVTAELLRRGHQVTAFVHHTQLAPMPGLQAVQGDIRNRASVTAAVNGHDVIICTLSSWKDHQKNVLSTAMQMIVPAAKAAGIARLVSLTGDGAQAPGDHDSLTKKITHTFLNTIAPKVLRDSEDHTALLAASSLDWTVLRSPVMTPGHRMAYHLSDRSASITIPRAAVAQAIADLAETDDKRQKAPYIRRS